MLYNIIVIFFGGIYMTLRRLVSLFLAIIFVFSLSACSKPEDVSPDDSSAIVDQKEETGDFAVNPLTGEENLNPDYKGKKPISITVNNVAVAQPVQSGIDKADVVFETEVEGGITRLLALYADPTVAGPIGTVRSLRVPFAEIACGMGSILVHHGIDPAYCAPLLPSLPIQAYNLDTTVYGYREKNGLALEHTLYTTGEKLAKLVENKKYDTASSGKPWLNFNTKKKAVVPGDGVANNVTVPFSNVTTTQFIFDDEEGKYIRANRKGVAFKDYSSGNNELFTNVFILNAEISDYPDGYHRQIDFSSGTGYYVSNGGYTEIKWSKGEAGDAFKFTTAKGKKLTVNRGNSYVCIVNLNKEPSFS